MSAWKNSLTRAVAPALATVRPVGVSVRARNYSSAIFAKHISRGRVESRTFFHLSSSMSTYQNKQKSVGPKTQSRGYASDSKRDFYEVLGVDKKASQKDIKKAYYQAAKQYHPDRAKGKEQKAEYGEKFQEISEAYEVLGDDTQRSQYDVYGHQGVNNGGMNGNGGGFHGQHHDPFEMFRDFESMFGQRGGRGGANMPQRGEDVEARIEVPFSDIIKDTNHKVNYRVECECDTCKGSGAKPGTSRSTCSRCGGSGTTVQQSGFFHIQATCPQCSGAGSVVSSPCTKCSGAGAQVQVKTVDVTIPAGVDDGMQMQVTGRGSAGRNNGPAGNLLLHIRVGKSRVFQRDGADVLSKVAIDMVKAALGGTVRTPTLTGDIELSIPAGTQPGDKLRLRGRGIPKLHRSSKGDHYIEFKVTIPKQLTLAQREILEELKEELENPNSAREARARQKVDSTSTTKSQSAERPSQAEKTNSEMPPQSTPHEEPGFLHRLKKTFYGDKGKDATLNGKMASTPNVKKTDTEYNENKADSL
eukprot:CFRG1026T1